MLFEGVAIGVTERLGQLFRGVVDVVTERLGGKVETSIVKSVG